MKQELIFISDGSKKVVGGYATILSGLIIHENTFNIEIILLTPQSLEQKYNKLLLKAFPEFNITIRAIFYFLKEDIYYLKLIILKYVSQNILDSKSQLIYIDYDHIVLSKIQFPIVNDESIFVSSEVKVDNSFSPLIHYNTSLIIANINSLERISKNWVQSYCDLKVTMSTRFLEEVSFSQACIVNKIKIIPASLSLQSGWHEQTKQSSLFHYGGICKESISMKEDLSEIFSNISIYNELRENGFFMAKKYSKILNKVN